MFKDTLILCAWLNRAQVLEKWPDAEGFKVVNGVWVCRSLLFPTKILGEGKTEADAWEDAARRLEE